MKSSPTLLFVSIFAVIIAPIATHADAFTVQPTADAYVAFGPGGALANNNYGGGGALGLAAAGLPNGEFQSVLKFNFASAAASFDQTFGAGQWTIQSVSLTLNSSPHNNAIYNEIAAGSFNISLMQNSSWTEGSGNASNPGASGITFNTLQSTFINAGTDDALGTFSFAGGSSGQNTYALNVAPGLVSDIAGGGLASLRLFAADNDVSYLFSSRAANPTANQPQLTVTAVPEPGTIALGILGLSALVVRRARR